MTIDAIPGREMRLGRLKIWRALPVRDRRLIGPWCFLDRYGPLSFTEGRPMDVAAHPHIGIQTVSWLISGEVLHLDSLGCEATVRPGGVNVMTSGRGIAHAEVTPKENRGELNGVQLWVALPESHRSDEPSFHHIAAVPEYEARGGVAQVFAGAIGSAASAAPHHSELVGADVRIHANEAMVLPLRSSFEHGLFVLSGHAELEGQQLAENVLYYLGLERSEVRLSSRSGARLLLIGGEPFSESILMWWNFVARTSEEIALARDDWQAGRRFGEVRGYDGPRLDAPSLGRLAKPNPAS
jgi:redox-sensitive bicupin YhaK (pirin superfamily)